MKNIKALLTNLTSGSKIVKELQRELSLDIKSPFRSYLNGLSDVLNFEAKRNNVQIIIDNLSTMSESEFVAWLDQNTGNKGGINGATVISRIKQVASRKLD